MENILNPYITKTPGLCGGKACIAGHRIRVMDIVVWHEMRGYCADEIVDMFPGITPAEVYAALAYYFDHRGYYRGAGGHDVRQGLSCSARERRAARGHRLVPRDKVHHRPAHWAPVPVAASNTTGSPTTPSNSAGSECHSATTSPSMLTSRPLERPWIPTTRLPSPEAPPSPPPRGSPSQFEVYEFSGSSCPSFNFMKTN